MRGMAWWGVLLVIGLSVAQAEAADQSTGAPGSDAVDQIMGRHNLYPAFDKLGRGVANFLGGWLEIPLGIHKRFSQSDTAGSFFTGTAHGVVRAVVRTGVGAYETVTFFLPYPENFAPILPPLEYFQKNTKREPLPLE